jgi:hypothetical protein
MYQPYQSDCVFRTCDIESPFSATYKFEPFPQQEPKDVMEQFVDDEGNLDEVMEEKLQIIEKRPVVKGKGKGKGQKKKKPARLPGEKLMKKVHRQHQLENSVQRVVKELTDLF